LVPLSNMVGNFVWVDLNSNGFPDEEEQALEGTSLYLLDENDNIVAFTESNENGHYNFYNLIPGKYRIKAIRPKLESYKSRSFESKNIEKEIYTDVFEIGEFMFIDQVDIGFRTQMWNRRIKNSCK